MVARLKFWWNILSIYTQNASQHDDTNTLRLLLIFVDGHLGYLLSRELFPVTFLLLVVMRMHF